MSMRIYLSHYCKSHIYTFNYFPISVHLSQFLLVHLTVYLSIKHISGFGYINGEANIKF